MKRIMTTGLVLMILTNCSTDRDGSRMISETRNAPDKTIESQEVTVLEVFDVDSSIIAKVYRMTERTEAGVCFGSVETSVGSKRFGIWATGRRNGCSSYKNKSVNAIVMKEVGTNDDELFGLADSSSLLQYGAFRKAWIKGDDLNRGRYKYTLEDLCSGQYEDRFSLLINDRLDDIAVRVL